VHVVRQPGAAGGKITGLVVRLAGCSTPACANWRATRQIKKRRNEKAARARWARVRKKNEGAVVAQPKAWCA